MASKLTITDHSYRPIGGTITYIDFEGNTLGSEDVPLAGRELSSSLVSAAWTAEITSQGYWEFSAPAEQLREGAVTVTLHERPTFIKNFALGLLAGYLFAQLMK